MREGCGAGVPYGVDACAYERYSLAESDSRGRSLWRTADGE